MNDSGMVIEVLCPARRRLIGLVPVKSKADLSEGSEVFKVTGFEPAGREIQRVAASELPDALRQAVDGCLLALNKTPISLAVTYSALTKDQNGHTWDLSLDGTWRRKRWRWCGKMQMGFRCRRMGR